MIKNGVYGLYFASCMNIIFNKLLSYIIFIANLSAILIETIL